VKSRIIDALLLAGLLICASALRAAQANPGEQSGPEQILVGTGKTRLLDLPVNIERVSVAAPETAEAVPVSARALMINGKAPGETSLVVWLSDGTRREYDIDVKVGASRIQAAKEQIEREFGSEVQLSVDNGSVYLTGRLRNLVEAQRAVSIAETLGKVVNLLKVDVPPQERQIMLKVRFADVDRSKSLDLGMNLFGDYRGYPFSATTGAFSPTRVTSISGGTTNFSLSDSLNLLLFDPHLNIGTTLKALANQNVLEILAEPNLLAMNGKEASFVAGGEFPFPNLQGGGGGVGQVTVSFREFGIRIHFLPIVTPRGTIRLHVTPEVSSLDFANSLSVQGATIPALNTRRVDTEIELQSGQSFAIAGLLDNRTTKSLSKIPGLANIPVLGKLFTSESTSKSNSELLVIVTPELVEPIAEGEALPELPRPIPFMEGPGILTQPPRTPGTDKTGPSPAPPSRGQIPVHEQEQLEKRNQPAAGSGAMPGGPAPAASNAPLFNPGATASGPGPAGADAGPGATVRTTR
jgi:pilus assembly protein CpaC